MLTIKKLSSTGFMLDRFEYPLIQGKPKQIVNNHWFSVDVFKILKNKKFKHPFESLKVGDQLDNIQLHEGKDGKQYVIDFDLISQSNLENANAVEDGGKNVSASAGASSSARIEERRNSTVGVKVKDSDKTKDSCSRGEMGVTTDSRFGNNVPVSLGRDVLERDGGIKSSMKSVNSQTPESVNSKQLKPSSVQDNIPKCVNEYVLKKYPEYEFRNNQFTCDLCGYPCVPREEKKNTIQDNIRYSQCVNIATQITRRVSYASFDDEINDIFNLTDLIYDEFNKRCSR